MATGGYSEENLNIVSGSDVVYDNICEPCKNDGRILEAEGMCEDCDEYLCKSCFLAHTVPSVTRHHVMIKTEEANGRTAERKDQCTQRCPQHKDEIVKYYCPAHCFLGCSACVIPNHQSCKGMVYIPDAAKDILTSHEYEEYKAEQSALQKKHKEIQNNFKERLEDVNKKQTSVIERIRIFRKEINEAFDKAEKEAIGQVEKMGSEKLTQLKSMQSRSSALKSKLYTKSSELEFFENNEQFCNLFIAMMKAKDNQKSTNKQLDEIDCRHDKAFEPRFHPNYDLDEAVCTVGLQKIFDPTKPVEVEHHADINARSNTDPEICWISSSAILPDNTLIVVDRRNEKIKTIDIGQKKLIGELCMDPFPWDVTVISSLEVAVTLPLKHKIAFIGTASGLFQHRVIRVGGECRGIAYHDKELFVSFMAPLKVEVMDMNGAVLRSVLTTDAGKSLLTEALYLVTQSVEKTVYVSDAGGSNVLCLKPNDNDGITYKDNKLQRPTGMMVDSTGMVYVCDWYTHTVHQITKDCKKERILLTKSDGLKKPYTISYCDKTDRFYIGMRDNDIIKVFKTIRP